MLPPRQKLFTVSGHAATAQWVTYSPDGSTLASGSDDGTIRLWDAATQHLKATLVGHTDQIRAVVFSPDGSILASAGGRDYTVRLWDVATGQALAVLTGHVGGVLSVAFSPNGSTLASAGGTETTPSGSGTLPQDKPKPFSQDILLGSVLLRFRRRAGPSPA